MDSGLGEHLAVHVDTGELEAVHEGGVVHAVCLGGSADTGDPQLTEVSLLQLAANVCVTAGLHHGLVSHLVVLGLCAPIALSKAKDLISGSRILPVSRLLVFLSSCHFLDRKSVV